MKKNYKELRKLAKYSPAGFITGFGATFAQISLRFRSDFAQFCLLQPDVCWTGSRCWALGAGRVQRGVAVCLIFFPDPKLKKHLLKPY